MSRKDKKAEKLCANCENAEPLADGETVLCRHYGVVDCDNRCCKFRYDPIKRIPVPRRKAELPDLDLG